MKEIKLSKKQKEVMKKLKNGDILHYLSGINPRCFFARMNVSWPTIHKLETAGLVERIGRYIELTCDGKTIII